MKERVNWIGGVDVPERIIQWAKCVCECMDYSMNLNDIEMEWIME